MGRGIGRDDVVRVAVPVAGSSAARAIDAGSGVILGPADENGMVAAWFEGNRNGAENLRLWTERVYQARSRAACSYPTVAVGVFPEDDFTVVGECGPGFPCVPEVFDRETVEAWCGAGPGDVAKWLDDAAREREGREAAEEFRRNPAGFMRKRALRGG